MSDHDREPPEPDDRADQLDRDLARHRLTLHGGMPRGAYIPQEQHGSRPIVLGELLSLSVVPPGECSWCDGEGWDTYGRTCEKCKGTGQLPPPPDDPL